MAIDPSVLAFASIALIVTITPGPDTMLVVRSALERGFKSGLMAMLGVMCGGTVHATLAAFGLSTILLRSAQEFEVVKVLGACYLVYLGVHSLLASRKEAPTEPEPVSLKRRTSFLEGMVTNILNPKVALFYVAFLPQFIARTDSVVAKTYLLVGIHYGISAVWLTAVGFLVARSAVAFKASRIKVWAERVTGVVFIGLGARLALERR